MPGGVSLGGAYFTLDATAAPLIQAMSQAEQASQKSVQAIAQQLGKSEKDVQRFAQTWVTAEKQRADASAAATLKIIKAHNDVAAAAAKNAASFGDLLKGGVALGAGLVGVHAGLEAVKRGLEFVTEESGKAAQAQFALNALYGAASPIITKFAEDQALAFGKSKADAKEAAANVATLTRNYALSGEQIQKVLTISANLAAVRGISLEAAAERTQSALRGEAEAIEYLGVAVQSNALKALANMTDAQRKNFETLSDVTKAQIILNAVTDQTADLNGKAAERLNTAAGATDNLRGRTADLAATLGTGLSPEIAKAENAMSGWIKKLDEVIQKSQEAAKNQREINAGLTHGIVDVEPGSIQVGPDPGLPGAGPGPTPAQAQALQDGINAAKRAAAARRDQVKADLAAADKANDATAKSAIDAIDRERKAKEAWYGEEKQRIEARRTYQLEDIDARKKAALDAIHAEAQATKDADAQAIKDAERQKRVRLDAAEEAKRQADLAIETQTKLNQQIRENEDRQTSDAREQAARQLSDDREQAARQLSDARQQADRDLAAARTTEDRQRETSHQDELRRIEEEHAHAVRALEDEADRDRKKSEGTLRHLEDQGKAEDDRHRKALDHIDSEKQRQLDAIDATLKAATAAIDAQLKALDDAQKARDNADRTSGLQGKVGEARTALTAATGTGTAAEIEQARQELTRAIQNGNEISVQNARDRLAALAGQGAEAVKKANEDLTKALADLQDEQTKEVSDAQREQLQTTKATLQAEASASKDAITRRADAEKSAEDEKDRRRKAGLDKDKQAEQDRLKDLLAKLDQKKQAESDDHDHHVRLTNDAFQTDTQRLKDARSAQDDALKDQRAAEDDAIRDQRTAEDRAIKDSQEAQDRRRIDERKAEDDALAVQKDAVAKTFDDEKVAADAAYNGPQGIITQLQQASVDHEREYSRQLAATEAAFEAERKAAERVYTNPEGNGQLDLLDKARTDEFNKLEASKSDWQAWSTAASAAIKAAMADLDEFIRHGANIPRIGGDRAAQPHGATGTLTSTSQEQSRSNTSGRNVQGDLTSWLNDAIDITGVADSWITGLQKLVSLESGGDPDILNREGSGASGLLQVKPATFAHYRDSKLPNDIFDPVANAVASIKYILDTYGDVSKIPGVFDGRTFKGYRYGGWISPNSVISDANGPYAHTEGLPERVLSPEQSQAWAAQAGGSSYHAGDVNFYGLTYEQAEIRQKRARQREEILTGVRR